MLGEAQPDQSEIRAAERRLAQALESSERTAWVYQYTEDAVFDAGGRARIGRDSLLEMAAAMRPMSSVSIRPLRTELHGDLAIVWTEASWTIGVPAEISSVEVRGILVWRKETDGQWRVAMEHIG